MIESREVMNLRQTASYLGVSPDTLYKYAMAHQIPAFKLGNRWKFKKSMVDLWMIDQANANKDKKRVSKPKHSRSVSVDQTRRAVHVDEIDGGRP